MNLKVNDMKDEQIIEEFSQIEKEKLRIEEVKVNNYKIIILGIISALFVFFFTGFLINRHDEQIKIEKEQISLQQKEFSNYYEECIQKLGIDTCKYITEIQHEEDNIEEITKSYGKCVESLGIEKCNIVRKNNEHVHFTKTIETIKENKNPKVAEIILLFLIFIVCLPLFMVC